MGEPDQKRDSFTNEATVAAALAPAAADPGLAIPGAFPGGEVGQAASSALFAGRYELLRELGRGGMGVVYQARDTMVGDLVALKTLELSGGISEGGSGSSAVERFRREVRLARRITHPNVARTHDLGEAEGRHYLTMEFVEGIDLSTLLHTEVRLSPTRAAAIAWMICEGLAAAHGAGIVHRDLKPANIIVERSGRVVLTDFGIARAFTRETGARTVGTVGTLVYMAPEQLTGAASDPRTDLYAVGLLLYEMLTGELAFDGDTPVAAAIARLHAPAPDPRTLVPEVPEILVGVIAECLEREPERRPATASAVSERLLGWLESTGKTPEQCAAMLQTSLASARPTTPMTHVRQLGGVRESTARPTSAVTSAVTRKSATIAGRVAVLPLRVRGRSGDHDYLGESLAETVIDLLGRTRGVEVVSASASLRFSDDRDPRSVGEALDVTVVVDGTLEIAGTQARVTVRLIEVASGTLRWSRRFSGSLADPFEFQDLLAQQIAEELRIELILAGYRDRGDDALLDLCRQARGWLQSASGVVYTSALGSLEAAAAEHPGFIPVLPLLGLIALRGWFAGSYGYGSGINWEEKAREHVARATREARDFPETRLARAMLAVQEARFRDAVVDLRGALAAAPAYPAAMQYLGSLQCEAGRAEEGLPRLRCALALNPAQIVGYFELGRCSALRGDLATFEEAMKGLTAGISNLGPVNMLRMRVAAWHGDRPTVEAIWKAAEHEPGFLARSLRGYGNTALGHAPPPFEMLEAVFKQPNSPRFAAMVCQIACEQCCLAGDHERALDYFNRAADSVLIDLEWIDHCPVLAGIRTHPSFLDARGKVRERVETIWGG